VQIVADVKTRRYSLFLGPSGNFWGKTTEENQAGQFPPYDLLYKSENMISEFCVGN
jgi:hypothetical protein